MGSRCERPGRPGLQRRDAGIMVAGDQLGELGFHQRQNRERAVHRRQARQRVGITRFPVEDAILRDFSFEDAHQAAAAGATAAAFGAQRLGGKLRRLQDGAPLATCVDLPEGEKRTG